MNQKNAAELFLVDFENYEAYLDTFITQMDSRFLRDNHLCRNLVTLGYRSSADVYTKNQFEKQRASVHEQLYPSKKAAVLLSAKINSLDPVLLELAAREKPNFQKILSTIVFLTHRSKDGFEVSGFIDLDASFAKASRQIPGHTNWPAVFQEKLKLRPKSDDLSYYDVHKAIVTHNNSDNYIVGHDVRYGLNFMHRGDHKKIFVDNTQRNNEQNYMRSVVYSPRYGYVVFFDHVIRKKI